MATFLAVDYTGVSPTGELRTRARQLELAAQPSPFTGSRVDYIDFRHFGPTVIAQGAKTQMRGDGRPDLRLIWTDIWMFRDGRWWVVASHDSVRLPAP